MRPLLQIQQLSLAFHTPRGRIYALRDVSLSVQPGEVLALVGESGCGKSVLCKSVLGLLPRSAEITGGKILLENRDLVHASQREMEQVRGDRIAAVFQDPYSTLDPSWSIGAQICETILVHRRIGRRDARQKAVQLLKQVGISQAEYRYDDRPHQFSGGQRQRIAVAIALACQPSLLIADEITTALDAVNASHILDLVSGLCAHSGTSVLLVTHDFNTALRADRIAVMYAGQIIEIGTAREIACEPRHPYTWALLCSLLSKKSPGEPLYTLPGMPPDLSVLPSGDAFAPRNRYAMQIDFEQQPPLFQLSATHFAATWLCHPEAPKVGAPVQMSGGEFDRLQERWRNSFQNQIESRDPV